MTEPQYPNSGRQLELDAVKAFAIFLIVIGHTAQIIHPECPSVNDVAATIYYYGTIIMTNLFSAPVFMFCMGVGLIYSRRSEAKDHLRRGISLMIFGYALCVSIGSYPLLLHWFLGTPEPNLHAVLSNMFCVDILQFAGFSFLFLAFVQWLRVPFAILSAFMLGLLIVGAELVGKLGTGCLAADNALGLIFWVNDYTCFPFSLWFPYILSGAAFFPPKERS